ncbi:hypothetical protein E2C01_029129 [Portunus trituberculatus]|uniref:Uncharacterized protein n=1 Tax=Portunus trituberculatus TaxID=210409 RepID=A0A5B7EMJ8_PORTR|nr:hypothetical protein [Portunus trituberculatus]
MEWHDRFSFTTVSRITWRTRDRRTPTTGYHDGESVEVIWSSVWVRQRPFTHRSPCPHCLRTTKLMWGIEIVKTLAINPLNSINST